MKYTSNRFTTANQCKSAIRILKDVREVLPKNFDEYDMPRYRSPFLCDNIRGESKAAEDLLRWIADIIGFSVFEYFKLDRYNREHFNRAQEIRFQMIEWMIMELKLKKKYLEENR